MADSHDLGQIGEDLAVEHLKKAGFRILFRNWKWGRNEIDIIAENKEFVIFVEVKTRNNDFQMHPLSSINRTKQRTIVSAASGYLKKFAVDKEGRFDIITVIQNNESYEIDHLEGAYYPTL